VRLLAVAAALGGLLAWPQPAQACTCGLQHDPPKAFAEADAVFAGTVISITDLTWVTKFDRLGAVSADFHPLLYRRVALAVNETWKGVTTTPIVVRTCGYPFTLGGQYVIYSYQSLDGLETDVCTRTKQIAGATVDLAYLHTLPSLPLRSPLLMPLVCVVGVVLLAISLTSVVAVVWRRHHGAPYTIR